MNEAYNARMAKGDYDGALAFATTEEQKQIALQKKASKDERCEYLRIAAAKARKDAEGRNQRWRTQAEAAEARFSSQCK
jgi:bifunctional DNA-binding transcriptional regulator/antitoxin component of YhaV-PrlF toxin-antitoxin module